MKTERSNAERHLQWTGDMALAIPVLIVVAAAVIALVVGLWRNGVFS